MFVSAEKLPTLICFTTVLIKCLCFKLINDANPHHGLQEPPMAVSQLSWHVCGQTSPFIYYKYKADLWHQWQEDWCDACCSNPVNLESTENYILHWLQWQKHRFDQRLMVSTDDCVINFLSYWKNNKLCIIKTKSRSSCIVF